MREADKAPVAAGVEMLSPNRGQAPLERQRADSAAYNVLGAGYGLVRKHPAILQPGNVSPIARRPQEWSAG